MARKKHTLNVSNRFPYRTKVRVYHENDARKGGRGLREPLGDPVEDATVRKDGTIELSDLKENTPYVLYAEVDGEHRYVTVVG